MSTIDHFFVNQRLLDLIEDAGPVHLGDNPSRHSPIMMKIKVDKVKKKVKPADIPLPRRPAWYKATQDHKDQYTDQLDLRLRALDVPGSLSCLDVSCKCEEHGMARDSHVLDILCAMVETSYECIPLTARVTRKEGKGGRQFLPGWKDTIAPLKSDSIFWHSVWISAGRPEGALHQVMCNSRRKYNFAIK